MNNQETPTINNLGSASWVAQITGYEEVIYKLTEFDVPEVSTGTTPIGNATEFTLQETGDHMLYENLELTFLVDENLNNYRKLHEWMRKNTQEGTATTQSVFISFMTNGKQFQGVELEFIYAFPIGLSKLSLDTNGDTTDLKCTVTFAYTLFDFV